MQFFGSFEYFRWNNLIVPRKHCGSQKWNSFPTSKTSSRNPKMLTDSVNVEISTDDQNITRSKNHIFPLTNGNQNREKIWQEHQSWLLISVGDHTFFFIFRFFQKFGNFRIFFPNFIFKIRKNKKKIRKNYNSFFD